MRKKEEAGKKKKEKGKRKERKEEKRSVGVVKVLRRTAGVQGAKRQLALSIMHKKKRPRNGFLSLLRGRLPTLPLSQYHRRGEA